MGAKKITPKSKGRSKRRVEDTEKSSKVTKSAKHRSVESSINPVMGSNGVAALRLASQGSELVPVAQYASVTIGPVMIERFVEDPGLTEIAETLAANEWDVDSLSKAQRKIYDGVKAQMSMGQHLVEQVIAEDRELVEESVRQHNAREEEEKKSKGK